MRPTDPKALKRKKRPLAEGKKTGVSRRHPTKAAVLEPVLAKDTRIAKGRERSAAPRARPKRGSKRRLGWRAPSISTCGRAVSCRCRARGRRPCSDRARSPSLRGSIRAEGAELVIVDHPLTPVQQRNLETEWGVKVLDRTGLILEIFGARARTREGRLQVELAHLVYQKSRLVRSWTHLERQRGGFGFLGGPAKPRSRPTGASSATGSRASAKSWSRCAAPARYIESRGRGCPILPWRSSATPMPASRRCSTR